MCLAFCSLGCTFVIRNNLFNIPIVQKTIVTLSFILSILTTQAQTLWEVEAESSDTHLQFYADSIELRTSAGLTLWYRQPISVPFAIDYEAMVVQRDVTDRLSDLNCFWLATDPTVSDGNVFTHLAERKGIFKNASTLQLYYFGYGGNYNTTSRFRRYNGQPQPPLLVEYTDAAHLLRPNHWYHIHIEATSSCTRYYIDGELLVEYADPNPLLRGWFGFRTTWSHCKIRGFCLR